MSDLAESASTGRNRGKLIIIAVLGLVLVGVLVMQFGGSASAKPTDATQSPRHFAAKGSRSPDTPLSADPRPWPHIALDAALKYDPFAPPPSLSPVVEMPKTVSHVEEEQKAARLAQQQALRAQQAKKAQELQQKRAAQQQALANVQKQGVKTIVGSGENYVAVIGKKTLRVGDRLDGFRVIAIDRDGVVLQRPQE